MLSVALSLLAGVLVALLFKLTFVHSWWGVIAPGLLVSVGAVALILRAAAKRAEPLMEGVQKHLIAGRREQAVKAMRDALSIGLWHPLIPGQLYSQIGAIEYVMGDLDAAEKDLEKASRWPWVSRAFLGCVYFKRRDEAKMVKAFEVAVKGGDKEGLAWTVYAWCLQARGKKDEAVKVLERALKKMPGDHRLEANLELVKEGKKMKTAPYGDKWSQFSLEGEGPVVPKAMRGFAVRPGFRQRPLRRKK